MLSNRQIQFIKYLEKTEGYITIKKLASIFDVSERTVRNDLDAIERFLQNKSIHLERIPRVGIRLKNKTEINMDAILQEKDVFFDSKENRICQIIVLLILKENVTFEYLEKELKVAKNTIVADFKIVQDVLKNNGISLIKKAFVGIELRGKEEQIRNMMFNLYIQALYEANIDVFEMVKKDSIEVEKETKSIINYIEKVEEIRYTDESMKELEGMITLSLHRIRSGYHVEESALMNAMENDIMYFYIKRYFQNETKMQMSKGDICYFAMLFRSSKSLNARKSDVSKEDKKIFELSKQLIHDFTNKMNIQIDQDEELCENLIMHLKVAIFRLRNHIKIENPFCNDIQYSTSFMYDVTHKLLKKYERLFQVIFPEEEIAFITMYFEVIYQKYIKAETDLNVIIVCDGGIATSSLLKQRLAIYIPELQVHKVYRKKDIQNNIDKIKPDLIISTLCLQISGYEVLKVNPILNSEDINKITHKITQLSYEKKNKQIIKQIVQDDKTQIQILLNPQYCQFEVKIDNWEEAIRIAASPLVYNKNINVEYVNEMIKVVHEVGNYMIFIPEIAFVHSHPKNVNQSSIALLNLANPIEFGSKDKNSVKVIVVVASTQENTILANLIKLLLVGNNIELFKNARSYEDLLKLEE